MWGKVDHGRGSYNWAGEVRNRWLKFIMVEWSYLWWVKLAMG